MTNKTSITMADRWRLHDLTRRWRIDNGYTKRAGVVVVFDNNVAGWVNELRDPQHWEPGCVAVDSDGQCWVAVGGNEQNGAEQWAKI